MTIDDPTTLLRELFRLGPGLSMDAWAAAAGVSTGTICNPEASAEARDKVAEGAALLLNELHQQHRVGILIGAGRMRRFMDRKPDPTLRACIEDLLQHRLCRHCEPAHVVHISEWSPRWSCCKPAHLRRKREQNPRIVEFRRAVVAALPLIHEKDRELAHALQRLLADPNQAITGPAVQKASGERIKAREFARRLERATGGLNKRRAVDWDQLKGGIEMLAPSRRTTCFGRLDGDLQGRTDGSTHEAQKCTCVPRVLELYALHSQRTRRPWLTDRLHRRRDVLRPVLPRLREAA